MAHARRRANLLQNLAITLLSLSAVGLFLRTQLLFWDTGYLSGLLSSGAAAQSALPADLTALPQPLRLVVTGPYGRYGDVDLTTADAAFSAPGSLLREALGSAGSAESCTQLDFRTALSGQSVFFDFLGALPLSVLGGLLGCDVPEGNGSARWLLLSPDGDSAALYLSDGAACSRRETHLTAQAMRQLVSSFQLGNAAFAYELEAGGALAPYSLLLTGTQEDYPSLRAAPPYLDSAAVLSALAFNPHTNFRYAESDGTEVIPGDDRTLRLRTDGSVLYQSTAAASSVRLPSAQEAPSAAEAVLGAWQLLSSLQPDPGDARLFLRSIEPGSGGWIVTFDYQCAGIPLVRSDGEGAAVVETQGGEVTELFFRARQYAPDSAKSLLLPLPQALAVARRHPGAELKICYIDGGGSAVTAGYLAE